MSEEYKLSNVTCGLDDTNYAICLEGEHLGYNKKALQEVADKANNHDKLAKQVAEQVAELRAALSDILKANSDDVGGGFLTASEKDNAIKALKENQ